MTETFECEVSRRIWDAKYRFRDGDETVDASIEQSWARVARTLSAVERDPGDWEKHFYDCLKGFYFLPGGRILAGAGTGRHVTLFNCFVMGSIDDSMDGIFKALKEGALTLQQGGGVGCDFSTLRPAGIAAQSVGSVASGPVSFMQIWDAMCGTLLSTGSRRGAMMATLRCDHPDIERFITAKRTSGQLSHFNLSVLISDDFIRAVKNDGPWQLLFPRSSLHDEYRDAETVMRRWSGEAQPVACAVLRTVSARELWQQMMRAAYEYAEPGVLFIDRINQMNNLFYRECISATNPCGEIPLPAYGACDLGSLNLTAFVREPFASHAEFDMAAFVETVGVAVRMLDNVIDVSAFPLPQQREQAQGSRRIGLGITGLADTLVMLGQHYDSDAARDFSSWLMRALCHSAWHASIKLAKEKGAFPFFDRDRYLAGTFVSTLPADIRQGIADHGIRNSHLLAIAPTGTISLLANNISSGLEPVYDFRLRRHILGIDDSANDFDLTDYALALWQRLGQGADDSPLPEHFVTAGQLSPDAHLAMQAVIQPFVDSAISKTINVPEDYDFEAFQNLYMQAFDRGLKGCTVFRPNAVTGSVLSGGEGGHCCNIDCESD